MNFMKVKTSLVQFARLAEKKGKNVERMISLLMSIERTDIVCLPENWVGRTILDEDEGNALISTLSEVASKKNFNLLTGGAYMYRGKEIFDTCHVIDRNGDVLGVCDKIFPSQPIGEREFLSSGKTAPVFEVDGLKIGVMICVDAVYPEICRSLASKGAEILFNPSNIPGNRLEMWKRIGATRAIENGVYYVFLNNTSTDYLDGRKITGHSFIMGPDGDMIFEAGEGEQVTTCEVDLTHIKRVRSRWPFLKDISESKLQLLI